MAAEKVLVLNATGKVGRNVCRALVEASYEVFGTTRSTTGSLANHGVKPVVCNYTIRADWDRAFQVTGAKKAFVITDYFRAAKCDADLECRQGRDAIDAANWNPLRKGVGKFLSVQECKYCWTYDIGRAAAIQFRDRAEWLGKSLDVIGWQGDLNQVAAALSKVSGVPVKAKLSMPIFLRRLVLKDLHHMFLYYEVQKGPRGTPDAFRKILPDALSAEDWFRFHNRYADGASITG